MQLSPSYIRDSPLNELALKRPSEVMSRFSISATNDGSSHVALGFLMGLVSLDFGLTIASMRRSSPSIVPGTDQDVYLVVDDFGSLGRAWRESNLGDTDLETVIDDLLEGQYNNPVLVVGFNVADGWVSRRLKEHRPRAMEANTNSETSHRSWNGS